MGCKQDVFSTEASLFELSNSVSNVVINKHRLWSVKEELWDSDPDGLPDGFALALKLKSHGSVLLLGALHAVDPDDSNFFAGSGARGQNNIVSSGDGCDASEDEVSHM